ncbi:hypothetical protein, partial [Klebsiella pasteurii]|uniref:hypothetical protein n=1 Tax=Klebsiella pasteurii TaxID=2587529 RepID=UPI002930352B
SVRHIFKPISYLEIQLLSGVSGGYIMVERYRKSNYLVEKNLSADFLTWEVNVKLPEAPSAPKVDKTFQQKMWRD